MDKKIIIDYIAKTPEFKFKKLNICLNGIQVSQLFTKQPYTETGKHRP